MSPCQPNKDKAARSNPCNAGPHTKVAAAKDDEAGESSLLSETASETGRLELTLEEQRVDLDLEPDLAQNWALNQQEIMSQWTPPVQRPCQLAPLHTPAVSSPAPAQKSSPVTAPTTPKTRVRRRQAYNADSGADTEARPKVPEGRGHPSRRDSCAQARLRTRTRLCVDGVTADVQRTHWHPHHARSTSMRHAMSQIRGGRRVSFNTESSPEQPVRQHAPPHTQSADRKQLITLSRSELAQMVAELAAKHTANLSSSSEGSRRVGISPPRRRGHVVLIAHILTLLPGNDTGTGMGDAGVGAV
ncbi:hypothetical protein B0H16DRAFT_1479507 [Mycena metata]|uniref:Uncharacterized protein n=1 Tax=Mycena metata TaxID=1033252 RepID=A0AAD7H4N7_9AGAR|nr:hypothetical protein B0H16DRAFT_1479507 [Mycena metata]